MITDRLGGRVVMIPEAGHYPQSEFPELTTPVVRIRAGVNGRHGCLGPDCREP